MPIENPFRGRNSDMSPDFSDAEHKPESDKPESDKPELKGLNSEFYNLGVELSEPSQTLSQPRKLRNPEFLLDQGEDEKTEKEKPAPLSPDQR